MAKIVGDSGDQILRKAARQVGPVTVHAGKAGFDVALIPTENGITFEASGKTLRAAIHRALKNWARSTDA